MTLEPLLSASLAIRFHVLTIVPAAFLGAFLLAGRKGTPLHRLLGKVWFVLMAASAFSTFFIHTIRLIGPFSPIHFLSAYVIFGSVVAIRAARRHDIAAHRRHVGGMYFGGIVVAGLFTFIPGRLMNEAVFAGSGALSGLASAALLSLLFVSAGVLAARQSGMLQRLKRRNI